MKKSKVMAICVFAVLCLFVSCQPRYLFYPVIPGNNNTQTSYTVTLDFNYEGSTSEVLENQTMLIEPEDPNREGDYIFAGWYLNGQPVTEWGITLTSDVTLTAMWKTVYETIKDVPKLAAYFDGGENDSIKQGFSPNDAIDYDGEGLIAIREWIDLTTAFDFTIKGVEFLDGLSIHTSNTEGEITINVSDCVIHACDQVAIIAEGQSVRNRIDNSGEGLCLAFDTSSENNTDRKGVVIVADNNKLIGKNDPTRERKGFGDWTLNEENKKGRGNGISLGNQAGSTINLVSATISNNTFEGLQGHAIQLYKIQNGATVSISGNDFISWGVNSTTYSTGLEDYAIRGDLDTADVNDDCVVLSNNTYASSMDVEGETPVDLSQHKAAINYWNSEGSYPNFTYIPDDSKIQ